MSPNDTVDDINLFTTRTLNYGNYCVFLIMGSAGFISSAVAITLLGTCLFSY